MKLKNKLLLISALFGVSIATSFAGDQPAKSKAEKTTTKQPTTKAKAQPDEVIPGAAAQTASYFYTGKPYDEDLEAYVFNYRNYSPEQARWSISDLSGFPDGANNYGYIRNNPLTWIDSTGLSGTLVINSFGSGGSGGITGPEGGHSWVTYTPDGGAPTTYGTYGNHPDGGPNGLYTNREAGQTGDATRTTHLNDSQEANFNKGVADYQNRGQGAWSLTNPCSGFASNIWRVATGEKLNDGWPISTPETLKKSIYKRNGNHDHGTLE